MNSLDDSFRTKTEPRAGNVDKRSSALKTLHDAGIETYLFMSPIFPGITDYIKIIEATQGNVDCYCFENLNLRGGYMPRVLNFIDNEYPELSELYQTIFKSKNITYWKELKIDIETYCIQNKVPYKIYFYH